MARVAGTLAVVVEYFARTSNGCDMKYLDLKLHAGTRTFNCSAPTASGREEASAAQVSLFKLETYVGEDLTLEVSDATSSSPEPIGTASFSLSRALATGSDRLEMPLVGTARDQKMGVLSLALTWTPASSSAPTASAPAGSRTPTTASAFAACAAGGAIPRWMKLLDAPLSASPAAAELSAPSQQQQQQQPPQQERRLQGHLGQESASQQPSNAPELTGAAAASPSLSSSSSAAPAAAAHASAAAAAASATVMAAMATVAAMIAAATELPATSPRSPTAATGAGAPGGNSSASSRTACKNAANSTFYPPIQPYDAVPPLEFGPGSMPSSSGGGAAGFYPSIALRLHFPADVSVRMDPLRVPVTSYGS